MNIPILNTTRGIHKTGIEWADYAVGSPFVWTDKATGEGIKNACVKCSSGCANCYAETIGLRFKTGRAYTKAEMDRLDIHLDQGVINSILRFKPKGPYKNGRGRPAVFLGDMTDLFGEWAPFEMLDTVYAAIALRPDVEFLILTKRAGRMREYITEFGRGLAILDKCPSSESRDWHRLDNALNACGGEHLANIWHGVSVENQEQADARIPHLLACPSAVRFVSYEPALGPVDFSRHVSKFTSHSPTRLDWLIVGGESGPGARPFNMAWAERTVKNCAGAGVPCFVKQMGSNLLIPNDSHDRWPRGGDDLLCDADYKPSHQGELHRVRLRDRGGGDPSEWPEHLRVRQMPGRKEKA